MDRGSPSIDAGMDVIDATGEAIGTVATVEDDVAHVDLDPGLADEIRTRPGMGNTDEDTYALRDEMVETVNDEGVHLQGDH